MPRAARTALTTALPALCSGCLLLGNPCGNKSHSEDDYDHSAEILIGDLGASQSDGTWLIAPIDCVEACGRFAGGPDLELLELDSCELSLHPGLGDPSKINDPGNGRDWTRVQAIEEPVVVSAEWRTDAPIFVTHCSGTYRTECKN